MASQNKGHISQLLLPIDGAEWLSPGHFILSRSAVVKFRVRSVNKGRCLLLPLSLTSARGPPSWALILPPSWGEESQGKEDVPLLYRTCSGYSEFRTPCPNGHKVCVGLFPTFVPKGKIMLSMCTLRSPGNSQGTAVCMACAWSLDMQAGCPQAFGPVCGKETGVGRERGWTAGQVFLHL